MTKLKTNYALFTIVFDKALCIEGSISPNYDSDLVRINTDSAYSPVVEHRLFNDFQEIPLKDAETIFKELGFIQVKEGFDIDNIDHLKEIKPFLNEKWIEKYNEWVNFSG